jgi:hypothetical protein
MSETLKASEPLPVLEGKVLSSTNIEVDREVK